MRTGQPLSCDEGGARQKKGRGAPVRAPEGLAKTTATAQPFLHARKDVTATSAAVWSSSLHVSNQGSHACPRKACSSEKHGREARRGAFSFSLGESAATDKSLHTASLRSIVEVPAASVAKLGPKGPRHGRQKPRP